MIERLYIILAEARRIGGMMSSHGGFNFYIGIHIMREISPNFMKSSC